MTAGMILDVARDDVVTQYPMRLIAQGAATCRILVENSGCGRIDSGDSVRASSISHSIEMRCKLGDQIGTCGFDGGTGRRVRDDRASEADNGDDEDVSICFYETTPLTWTPPIHPKQESYSGAGQPVRHDHGCAARHPPA